MRSFRPRSGIDDRCPVGAAVIHESGIQYHGIAVLSRSGILAVGKVGGVAS